MQCTCTLDGSSIGHRPAGMGGEEGQRGGEGGWVGGRVQGVLASQDISQTEQCLRSEHIKMSGSSLLGVANLSQVKV